jgi:Zn-dependent peptidase ImmA (M78 family)/transcriptional regulator with XRE-family HTH domain
MASEEIPVTPAIVAWARTRAGYSIEEASKTFKKIGEWESGDSAPTYAQLEQLADKFKLPIAVFFFPEPPKTPPISESFRTLPDQVFAEIPRRVQYLLRKAKAFQLNLMELSKGQNLANRTITRELAFPANISAMEMARLVRDYLNVPVEQQIEWPDAETALENWRQIFGTVGIFVFKDAFKAEDYSGFCLYDDAFPIIYVNNSTAKTRQTFTLFHELAHLLFHTSGIDTVDDEYIPRLQNEARRIEVLCNRFAAAFLVPEEAFNASLTGQRPTEETAEALADRFNVSRELIYRKFLDRGLIDQNAYERAARRWAEQGDGGSGGDYYNNQFAYLGRDYIRLALSEYQQNRIDEAKLAEYLNIAPKNVEKFEERFARRRA